MDIQWEDPPPAVLVRKDSPRGKYVGFAAALREHKDKWAVMPAATTSVKSAAHTCQNIRRGILRGFAKGEYEAVADGTKIYVRWIGPREIDDEEVEAERLRRTLGPRIRKWAKKQGMEVTNRGRIPQAVMDAYFAQTGTDLHAVD